MTEVHDRDGVDPSYVDTLLEAVNSDGYVIIPDLIPPETVAAIREASEPFLYFFLRCAPPPDVCAKVVDMVVHDERPTLGVAGPDPPVYE